MQFEKDNKRLSEILPHCLDGYECDQSLKDYALSIAYQVWKEMQDAQAQIVALVEYAEQAEADRTCFSCHPL